MLGGVGTHGAQKWAGRRARRSCGQTTPPGLSRTLHFWVLHEHKEGVAQRGAQGLGAAKEQVICGHQEGVYVEVA